jgi:tripartite-type tricarboxylate transporter receptor subunit TctC
MAVGAVRPAFHHREPGGRWRHHRHRSGREGTPGRSYAPIRRSGERNATLYEKLNYNFIRDIAPVATFIRQPNVMVVNPSVPAKTVPEFIAYAKANPGKINMASAGNGTGPHLAGELFKTMSGVDMIHVPYRGGGPALTDLLAGQVQITFIGPTASIEYIKTGKLRALAVTTATRSEALPDIPTVGDFLPGYEASQWYGVGAPKKTPAEIIDKLNEEINVALTDTKLKARLTDLGATVRAFWRGTIMKLPRRQFLHLAAGAAALPAVSRVAWAQAYPSRPVRWIVGFAAGSPADVVARPIAQWLSDRLGQPVVIENRPGAGGNIATEAVAKAAPDGYTLLLANPANAINATLYDKLSFDFIRDTTPVAGLILFPNLMLVNPTVPAKAVPEFIAYAKANPGKINFASVGNGTVPHVAGELFNMMASVKMVHVPYRGGLPALTDLLSGQVQVYFATPAITIAHVKAGKLRALAVTTTKRLEELPDTPTVSDFLPGYEANVWFGVSAPRNTPTAIVDKLNTEINAALADPTHKARLADLGAAVLAGSPADFGKLIADETEKWGKVIRAINIKVE